MPPLLSEEALKKDLDSLRERYEAVLSRMRAIEAELLLFRKELSQKVEDGKKKQARRIVDDL